MKREVRKSNILLTIVMFILIILGISTISNATDHGKNVNVSMNKIKVKDTFNLSMNEYDNNVNRLLCIEHNQKLSHWTYNKYIVKAKVKIEGDSCEGEEATGDANGWNARLAAAIHYTSGQDRREAMWYYFPNWVDKIGRKFGVSPKYVNNNNDGLPKGLKRKVNNYVSKVKNGSSDTDAYIEQNDTTITTNLPQSETYRNDYVKVGPFNFEFEPQLASIKVRGIASGETESKVIDDIKFVQSGETFTDAGKIKSKKDFSILVPINITKITKIKLKTEEMTPMKAITAEIAILVAGTGSEAYQNLAIVETSAEPGEPSDAEFDYSKPIDTTADLSIEKVDEDNNNIKLSGVGFKFKHKQTGKWVKQDSSKNITYVSEAEATTFVTDKNGKIKIEKLLLGDYEVKEVIQPNYGYKLTTTTITLSSNSSTVKAKIKNKQVYIKLSGKVWIEEHNGKLTIRNDYLDSNDHPAEGVMVYLKDSKGNIVHMIDVATEGDAGEAKKPTDQNGEYSFEGIETDKIGDYHVEFVYNGLTYTNVTPGIYDDSKQINMYAPQASKAAESADTRDTFNKSFSVVENGGSQTSGITKDASGNKSHDLTYNIADHKATLINNGMLDFPIMASTTVTGYSIKTQYETQKASNEVFEGIEHINLGLYVREQPDIAVVKDLQNVRLTINGYEHTYQYEQRFLNQGEYGDGFNVGVKFGNKYGKMKYTRAIYKSDFTWENPTDKNKELQVYITYKIQLKNESTNLITKINNIVDYYDSTYEEPIGVGTGVDKKGNITGSINNTKTQYNNNYKKMQIDTNVLIKPQETQDVYVQFKLSREKVVDILNNKEALENVVEINSYSTFDMSGNTYAGIDKDSAPGNAIPGKTETYEDDTDSAPALQLEVANNARHIQGIAFLDSTDDGLLTAKIREGDGKYTEGEKTIDGVKVKLVEKSGTGLVYYIGDNEAQSITSGGGKFDIQGFIPGDYELVYTWGEQYGSYSVQDYKGTVYNKTRYDDITDGTNLKNGKWYRGNGVNENKVSERYTDAIDNYETRLQIDDEIKNRTYTSDSSITPNRTMDSTTLPMNIGVEYEDVYTASSGDEYTYEISNIDFGIVKRAVQQGEIKKRVSHLRVTLANGEVVSDVDVADDANRTLTGEKSHVTAMGPTNRGTQSYNPGFIKVELDNELIQGAKIEVTYEFKFNNISEVDVMNSNYYKFGGSVMNEGNYELHGSDGKTIGKVKEDEVVYLTSNVIIDYLDKDWGYEANKNSDWTAISKDEVNINGNQYTINVNNEQIPISSEVFGDTSDINNKIILYTTALKDQKVLPGISKDVKLNVSKTLTTSDEISLDNDTEILKLTKPGGSKIPPVPGNYVPGTSTPIDTDEDRSETVIVTPSTGDNLAYVLPITLGIGLLVILGTGVILIKKKVLGNKE